MPLHSLNKILSVYREVIAGSFDEIIAAFDKAMPGNKSREDLQSNKIRMIESTSKVWEVLCKSTCVNCWYNSSNESEAMWKLYSDSGKGIAIKTSIKSLKNSVLESALKSNLYIDRVNYLDFFNEGSHDDNFRPPLIKRIEYAHENEVRLYMKNPNTLQGMDTEDYKPEFRLVDVNPDLLIEEVYISPYVAEPFGKSVRTICQQFGLPLEKVKDSELFESYNQFLEELHSAVSL